MRVEQRAAYMNPTESVNNALPPEMTDAPLTEHASRLLGRAALGCAWVLMALTIVALGVFVVQSFLIGSGVHCGAFCAAAPEPTP